MPKLIRKFSFFLNYSTIFLLLMVFAVSRCKKESSSFIQDNSISLHFSPSTISHDQADSAIVLFTKGDISVRKMMIKQNREFKADLSDLEKGEWMAQIYLYARVQDDNYSRRYDLTKTISIAENGKGVRIPAATGLFDDQWKPRVIITNNDRSVVLIAALDPKDPYTDLDVADPAWDYSYVDRTALYKNETGEQRTDGSSWECDGDCYADGSFQFEPTAFAGFSLRMASRNWLRSEVYGLLMNRSTGEELNLYYLFNR